MRCGSSPLRRPDRGAGRRRWTVAALIALVVAPAAAQAPDDNPRLRWEDFYRRRAYPFGTIPQGALQRARQHARALGAGLRLTPPPISGTQWQPLGPAAIPISGTSIGRMSAIAVHPTNGNVIYVGGAQGGVWKTVNGGASWTPLSDQECSLAMGSIALDPVNPDIVYAGTGEQHFSGDSYYGCGVLRSTDGGATWTQLGAGVLSGAGTGRISRVVIAPSTAGNVATTTVVVASDFGLFRSVDGGTTWSERLDGIVTDLVVHPTNDLIWYAALRGVGVYKSINRGDSWTAVATGFPTSQVGRINIAIAPTAPETLYAAVHNSATNTLLGMWRTTSGGSSWSSLTATNASCGGQCWYDLYVAVHPTTPTTVYLGGVSLYRSTDAGGTFAVIGNLVSGGAIHVDHHLMVFDPQNANRVYAANDGGIYRSEDAGTSWTSLNSGLELTQFYEGISLHPSDQTIVLGGTQDNGTLQYTGQPAWLHVLGGDGGFTAIDAEDPIVRYAETQWSPGSGFSGPRRSDGGSFIRKVNGIGTSDRALFIPPLVMDPSTPSTLYFGTFQLYRTTDRAETWSLVSPDLSGGGSLSAIAPAPSDPQVIYVGANTGVVSVTTDGGANWATRTTGLPTRFIQDVAVDRADALTAYVVVSGFGGGHVFRTTDGGLSWVNRSGNLPDVPVNAVIVDPADRGIVLVGTDVGVFGSADSGATWGPIDQGMPNVAIYDIAYNPATAALIAATHGRGMFQLQLNRPLTLALVPRVRRDSVIEGATGARPDSAAVVLTGTGAGGAAWSATHAAAAPWLTVTSGGGTGSGPLRWSRDPSGLTAGTYVDTLTVTAAGAIDSPWRLIDSLIVEAPLLAAVTPTSRSDTALQGSTVLRSDSAAVQLTGAGAGTAPWVATLARGVWLGLTTANGSGPGMVRWFRNPAGLAAGVHVDTITVSASGATTTPRVIDSLVVIAGIAAFDPAGTTDSALSGSAGLRAGSAQLLLAAGQDLTTPWTAGHGSAPWLSLETPSGTGTGTVSWTRSAFDLADGVYQDTITVVTAANDTARIIDRFVVQPHAVATACVGDHLLGLPCLDLTARRWLDLAGNRDGMFNLGDLVALLSRGGPIARRGPRTEPR